MIYALIVVYALFFLYSHIAVADLKEYLITEHPIRREIDKNKEEISKIKTKLAEIEKNQKYILDTLVQKEIQGTGTQQYSNYNNLDKKLGQIILSQAEIQAKLAQMERDIKRQLLLQNMIQFVMFSIFIVFMLLLYRYKKETTAIGTKIDDMSSKIEENKKETIRLLIEKAKDDPKIAMAVKNLLDDEKKSN